MTDPPPIDSLTPRQFEVAVMVRDAWTDKQIAGELRMSPRRVRQIIAIIARRWQLDPQRNARVQIAQRVA